jgi:endoglycosylceramidase
VSGRRRALALLAALALAAVSCSDGDPEPDRADEPPAPAEDRVELSRLWAVPDPAGAGRIVDADGREVRLRGVNVNALAEYWSGHPDFPTVFPLAEDDPEAIASLGFNAVRLLLSWSRVEPEPGEYDEGYLDEAAGTVERLAEVGVYTILDLHQDAWGPTLAAPEGTTCPEGSTPALGWDGAPDWATLDGGASRCATGGTRELSPAVMAAWDAFFADAPGPGGVGIQQRYVDMLAHVAGTFAGDDAVAGIDLVNEPGAFGAGNVPALSRLYERALRAIRAAEDGQRHLVLFEPPALWSAVGSGPPPPFAHDDGVVYAPHVYTGGFTGGPITAGAFDTAVAEARGLGGVPVLTGEWGAGPERAGPDGDGYFVDHQDLQDRYGVSATLWTWRESCGDPHKIQAFRDGDVPEVWGLFDVDCRTNEVRGRRDALAGDLRRGWVRVAAGRLETVEWDAAAGRLAATGVEAEEGQGLVAWVPCPSAADAGEPRVEGLRDVTVVDAPGDGCLVQAEATAAAWTLEVGAEG